METCAYADALEAIRCASEKSLDPYDLCVAFELQAQIKDAASKMSKRSKARRILESSAPRLFNLACEVVNRSAGAAMPSDAARGVIESFVELGMDFDITSKYVTNFHFAVRS